MNHVMKLGILISGRGSNMRALVDACASTDFPAKVALVLSNVSDAPGLDFARQAGIPTAVVRHKDYADRPRFEQAMDVTLQRHGVDMICLAGFMRLLSPWLVTAWHNRMINIHPSLLPSYKGLHTHERILADGGLIHGCTVHVVRQDMDSGPILAQAAVPVLPEDTPETLAARVLACEHRIYPLAVHLLASGKAVIEADTVKFTMNPDKMEHQTLIVPAVAAP